MKHVNIIAALKDYYSDVNDLDELDLAISSASLFTGDTIDSSSIIKIQIITNRICEILNVEDSKRDEKLFCNFTIEGSKFCSRYHDCSLCDKQPKK